MAVDTRKPRILMVLESVYPTSGGGGAENQVRTLANYFTADGSHVAIVTPMTPDSTAREWDTIDGIDVRRIPYPRVRMFGGLVLSVRLIWHLLTQRRNYDVIHAHIAHNMAAISALMGRLLGKTVVVKFTGWMELETGVLAPHRNGLVSVFRRFALRRAHHVQATSHAIRRRLLERGFRERRVHVIPNAVDMKRFSAANDEDMRRSDVMPLTGIYSGRFVPVKALDILLDAWIAAFPPDAPVRLLLVGDGELKAELEDRIRKAGRTVQIQLPGPQNAVETLLSQADFGVLVSLHEGLSNTLLEYMAAGLPVLGTRISGTEDLIENGTHGWLVPPGDKAALVECLRDIARIDRPQIHAMGRVARERVRWYASIETVTQQLEQLYQSGNYGPSPRGARST